MNKEGAKTKAEQMAIALRPFECFSRREKI
jgi:hypothetical protein